jgi:hypothetical protein
MYLIQTLKMWSGFIWLKKGLVAETCEHGNKPSSSIKDGYFIN